MNFARDVIDAAPRDSVAIVELGRDGSRRECSYGELSRAGAALAGRLREEGVREGDVVLTLMGNRPEWAFSLAACFRIGAVVLPCSPQLRVHDLRLRLAATKPRVLVCDEEHRGVLQEALDGAQTAILVLSDPEVLAWDPAPVVELAPEDPCLITFTSGTSGEPKAAVHAQRYLTGQALQAQCWLDVRPGDVLWCTASAGWSKSARNAIIAPWLRGATTILHDGRFDPEERLELIEREAVNVLCMSPTEYRMIAARTNLRRFPTLRKLVAAGEHLDEEVLAAWQQTTGLWIHDGYGQTETGHLTAIPRGIDPVPGSIGLPLPGVRLWVHEEELVVDPTSIPTFFLGYLEGPRPEGPWKTGDLVSQDNDGFLRFRGRKDDVIISAGYRIGPQEVESVLAEHPAVAESAVVEAPDPERGSLVRAVVVLNDGFTPTQELAHTLQEHVKAQTAPYKYPRLIDFVAELPRTTTGKVSRAALRS